MTRDGRPQIALEVLIAEMLRCAFESSCALQFDTTEIGRTRSVPDRMQNLTPCPLCLRGVLLPPTYV